MPLHILKRFGRNAGRALRWLRPLIMLHDVSIFGESMATTQMLEKESNPWEQQAARFNLAAEN